MALAIELNLARSLGKLFVQAENNQKGKVVWRWYEEMKAMHG